MCFSALTKKIKLDWVFGANTKWQRPYWYDKKNILMLYDSMELILTRQVHFSPVWNSKSCLQKKLQLFVLSNEMQLHEQPMSSLLNFLISDVFEKRATARFCFSSGNISTFLHNFCSRLFFSDVVQLSEPPISSLQVVALHSSWLLLPLRVIIIFWH